MKVRLGTAFGLGVIGALVVTLIMVVIREAALSRLNLEMIHGALLTGAVGPMTWSIGCVVHLLAGGSWAIVYGALFEAAGRAGWRLGMLLGLVHAVLTGIWLALLPALHPSVPEHPWLPAPGFLAADYGVFAAATVLASHLLFGLIVGGGYPVREARRRSPMSHGPA